MNLKLWPICTRQNHLLPGCYKRRPPRTYYYDGPSNTSGVDWNILGVHNQNIVVENNVEPEHKTSPTKTTYTENNVSVVEKVYT